MGPREGPDAETRERERERACSVIYPFGNIIGLTGQTLLAHYYVIRHIASGPTLGRPPFSKNRVTLYRAYSSTVHATAHPPPTSTKTHTAISKPRESSSFSVVCVEKVQLGGWPRSQWTRYTLKMDRSTPFSHTLKTHERGFECLPVWALEPIVLAAHHAPTMDMNLKAHRLVSCRRTDRHPRHSRWRMRLEHASSFIID